MSDTTLQLSQPAYLTLQTPDGGKQVRIDVYEARRALDDARRQPTEQAHYAAILTWLAGKLDVPRDSLAENMALEFNDCIVRLVERLNEERKKKADSIAVSLSVTQEFPPTSAVGP